jgi:hypothetical protein
VYELPKIAKFRVRENVVCFSDIISGRCFVTADADSAGIVKPFDEQSLSKLCIKIDKSRWQLLEDENFRGKMDARRPVFEVILIVEGISTIEHLTRDSR